MIVGKGGDVMVGVMVWEGVVVRWDGFVDIGWVECGLVENVVEGCGEWDEVLFWEGGM